MIERLRLCVDLGDRDQPMASRVPGEVGKAQKRSTRDALRCGAFLQPVDLLVPVVDEEHGALGNKEFPTAVLMHA